MKIFKSFIMSLLVLLVGVVLVACDDTSNIPNEFTISFDTQGGNTIPSMTVQDIESLELPTPTKAGSSFEGWYIDVAFANEFDSADLTANITLYAKWSIHTFTVTFETDGGTDIDAATVEYNQEASAPDAPTKAGYAFTGWFADEALETEFDFETPITANLTLYAGWEVVITQQDLVHEDIDGLELPSTVSANFTLPAKGANGTNFVWTSNKTQFIAKDGKVLLAGHGTGGATVTLTLTATLGSYSTTTEFEIFVPEKEASYVSGSVLLPFESVSTEFNVEASELLVYFIDGTNLPYVDIESFAMMINGAINSATETLELEDADGLPYTLTRGITFEPLGDTQLKVIYSALYEQEGESDEFYTYEMIFDFENNWLTTDNFSFFDAITSSTETSFGEGLTYGETYETPGDPIVFDFKQYRIDLITHEGEYLIPLSLANLMFLNSQYFDVYYNGDKIWGFDVWQIRSDAAIETQIRTSSHNSGGQFTLAMSVAAYDYLALVLDYFYGLKAVNGVETYYDVLGPFINEIAFGRRTNHYKGIFDFILSLDDLHTYHNNAGYHVAPTYDNSLTSITQLKPRSASYYQASWAVDDAIAAHGRPNIRITPDGRTAIVAIDSFTVDTPNAFKFRLDDIKSSYPNVVNVVVDLSDNGGGNVGAVWRTLGYMTDDMMLYHSQNPTEGSTLTYEIFDEYDAYDFNWYIMISPVTFSAANLMASMAKELGIATVIGIKSGGGASSITPVVLPTGEIFFMSSTNVISTKTEDGEYLSVEYGILPDYALDLIDDIYNNQKVQDLIDFIEGQ